MKIVPKKFTFAVIAIIITGIVTIKLSYPADAYLKALGIICGIFTFAQAYTDVKGGKNGL